jgi:hypothetical protein
MLGLLSYERIDEMGLLYYITYLLTNYILNKRVRFETCSLLEIQKIALTKRTV